MGRLTKLRTLPPGDRRLLAQAVLYVTAIRCALVFLSLRRVCGLADRLQGRQRKARHTADRIAWAVAVAGRFVPRSTCLVEAFAAHVIMRRNGLPSVIRVGVDRNVSEGFRAHAWVECAGKIAVGGSQAEGFTPIVEIGART